MPDFVFRIFDLLSLSSRLRLLPGSPPRASDGDRSGPASTTRTLRPASASVIAATPPVAPEPITIASKGCNAKARRRLTDSFRRALPLSPLLMSANVNLLFECWFEACLLLLRISWTLGFMLHWEIRFDEGMIQSFFSP